MSDTSNLASSNIEPSMEDILSSIRKVIAEDLSQKETDENRANSSAEESALDIANAITPVAVDVEVDSDNLNVEKQQAPAEAAFDDILELSDLLGDGGEAGDPMDEMMELIQLEDETEIVATPAPEQAQEQEFETLTVPSPNLPDADAKPAPVAESPDVKSPVVENMGDNMGFDETLDLVMDSEAADYVTETVAPITAAPHEETVKTPKTAKAYDGPVVDIADHSLFDVKEDEEETSIATYRAQEAEQVQASSEDTISKAAKVTSNNASDDMDLVKSLLEDLMDEPVSESVTATIEAAVTETAISIEENFSEDELLIPEPEVMPTDIQQSETIEDLIQASPKEDIFEALAVETPTASELEPEYEIENDIENELAQIAREIADARDIAVETTSTSDDIVELASPDYASKLAISASLAGSTMRNEDKPEGIMAAAAESDLESLQQLLAEADLEDITLEAPKNPDEIPNEIEMLISPIQEEETMATPVKNDILSDADTQQEVGNAFASLTTTVQERALAEENGPPIGELVKEALRPMLQEWLDKNLKAMVQRAVTKEIKRISTGK